MAARTRQKTLSEPKKTTRPKVGLPLHGPVWRNINDTVPATVSESLAGCLFQEIDVLFIYPQDSTDC